MRRFGANAPLLAFFLMIVGGLVAIEWAREAAQQNTFNRLERIVRVGLCPNLSLTECRLLIERRVAAGIHPVGPDAEELAEAVAEYCSEDPERCRGERGRSGLIRIVTVFRGAERGPQGLSGAPGPGPTTEQLVAAIDGWCRANLRLCQGPAGPAGPAGPQGPAGPSGAAPAEPGAPSPSPPPAPPAKPPPPAPPAKPKPGKGPPCPKPPCPKP